MRFNYNKSYKNLVPKLPPASDRFYANSNIDSSDKNNLSNKDSDPARSANYPTSNIGIRLLSFNSFANDGDKDNRPNGDVVIAPVNKPKNKEQEHDDNTIGIIHNIYTFDITQVSNPDISLDSGFIPADMNIETNTPGGSAYITTYAQFKLDRLAIVTQLADSIKNLPPFSLGIVADDDRLAEEVDRERQLAAARFLIKNNYVPKFTVPKVPNFTQDTIKYSYCKYDNITSLLTEEKCGIIEDHELKYLTSQIVFDPNLGLAQKYHIITYPIVLYPGILQPMCDKCGRWVVYCTWIEGAGPIVLDVYDEDFYTEDSEFGLNIFDDYDKAQEFYQQQMDIPVEQYKWCFIDDTCIPIHPLCYNSENWETEFPPEDYPLYDSEEDCQTESGGVLSTNKAYYFNTNTKQWEYK